MANRSPLVLGIGPAVYLDGGRPDIERLFDGHVPELPAGELAESGEIVYHVQHHSQLASFTRDYLTALFRELGPDTSAPDGPQSDKAEERYGSLLRHLLVDTGLRDRRNGLVHLFWLSHSQTVAETVSQVCAQSAEVARLRFAIHPLLARFLEGVWAQAGEEIERSKPGHLRFVLGTSSRTPLVDALIEDQLPLVLTDIQDLDFNDLLRHNSRYRLSTETFLGICRVLSKRIEERLASSDPILLAKLSRSLPGVERRAYAHPSQWMKMLLHPDIRQYLWMDMWQSGDLTPSEAVPSEADRGSSPLTQLETFDDLAAAVQRFEVICRLRSRIRWIPSVLSEGELRERYGQARVYRFTETVEVVGNAVAATVLFLDLREFTKTSEGMWSERDLTHQLYSVFDPFVEIVSRFSGEVDKFLGDGMMVTFGATHHDRYGPVNALRAAVLLQEKLRELRELGTTPFTMGISIHYGRVYVAHFRGTSERQDTTVIGRNVNLVGRMSSTSKLEFEDEEATVFHQRAGSGAPLVFVDKHGALVNEGIALSREAVTAIEEVLPLTRYEEVEEWYGEVFDPAIGKRIRIRYAGEAKFKGVRGSFPVYSAEVD